MALSLPFQMEDVYDEFGVNTAPSKPASFRNDIYAYIFGSAPSGSRLSDFDGYGRPIVSAFSVTTSPTLGGYLRVSFDINVGSLESTVVIQYAEFTGSPIGSGDWTTISTTSYTSNSNGVNIDFAVPETETDYHVRVKSYNLFTVDDDVWVNGEQGDVQESSEPATDPLQLDNLTFIASDSQGEEWIHTWEYPASGGTFNLEASVDGSPFDSGDATLQNLTYEGSNIWSATFQLSFIATNGDDVQFRIRRASTTEPFTSTQNFTYGSQTEGSTSQPSITTLSADQIDEDSARMRMDVTAFDDVAGQQYQWWFEYRETGAGTWTETAKSTASNTGTKTRVVSGLDDNTEYEFRAVASNTLSGTDQLGSTLDFTTDQLNTNPTNVSWIDNGVNSQVTWNTPASGNPSSYTINISVDGGANQNIVSGLSGASTSHTFDICDYADMNSNNAVVTVIAVSPSGSGSSSSEPVTSSCF